MKLLLLVLFLTMLCFCVSKGRKTVYYEEADQELNVSSPNQGTLVTPAGAALHVVDCATHQVRIGTSCVESTK